MINLNIFCQLIDRKIKCLSLRYSNMLLEMFDFQGNSSKLIYNMYDNLKDKYEHNSYLKLVILTNTIIHLYENKDK